MFDVIFNVSVHINNEQIDKLANGNEIPNTVF